MRRSQLHVRVAHSGLRRKGARISLFALPTVALCQVESVHSRNEQRLRLPDFWDILIGGDRLQSLVPDPCEDAEFSPSTDKVCTPERRAESRFRTTCCRSTSDEQSSTKAPERHLCFTAEQQTVRVVSGQRLLRVYVYRACNRSDFCDRSSLGALISILSVTVFVLV